MGVLDILLNIKSNLFGTLGGSFSHIVSDDLTFFVLIDLFKTFVDYRVHEESRLTYVTNVTILIVMREIAAGLYAQRYDFQFILGLSTLLLILGIVRALAIKYPSKLRFHPDQFSLGMIYWLCKREIFCSFEVPELQFLNDQDLRNLKDQK